MSADGKRNLEELKKSFPSLDELSASKLLGGNFHPDGQVLGGGLEPTYEGHNGPLPPVEIWGSTQGGSPPTPHPSPPNSPYNLGGSVDSYFGDIEWGDDYGDFGWDEGWGDQDGGTDSNPGGSEGGSGQNSSENPGGQQPPDYADLPFHNSTTPSQHAHRTYNNSSVTLYGKPDHDTPNDREIVAPGGYTDVALDAFKLNGHVYKVTDGYGTLTVTDDSYSTHYSDVVPDLSILSPLDRMEIWLFYPGNPCHRSDFFWFDSQWDNIFSPP